MTSHIKIKLELNSSNMIEVLEAHQGDKNSRFIDVMLTSDGEILQIGDGLTAKYDATIDNIVVADDVSAIVDVAENIVTVELTENMLSMSGLLKIDLKILESDSLITAQTLRVKVGKSVINNDSKFEPTGGTIKQFMDEVAAARGNYDNLKLKIESKENNNNKVTDKSKITDENANYPSIKYLDGYYYDYGEVDNLLTKKADIETTSQEIIDTLPKFMSLATVATTRAMYVDGQYLYHCGNSSYAVSKNDISVEVAPTQVKKIGGHAKTYPRGMAVGNGYLYVPYRDMYGGTRTSFGDEDVGGYLDTINLSDFSVASTITYPREPYDPGDGRGTRYYGKSHNAATYDDKYLCVTQQLGGWILYDIETTPENPTLLYKCDNRAQSTIDNTEFQQPAFYTDGTTVYLAIAGYDRHLLKIYNLNTPTYPICVYSGDLRTLWQHGDTAYLHTMGLVCKYPYIYCTVAPYPKYMTDFDNTMQGVAVVDVSDINRVKVNFYKIPNESRTANVGGEPSPQSVAVTKNHLVMDMFDKGISVWSLANPAEPKFLGNLDTGATKVCSVLSTEDGRTFIGTEYQGGNLTMYRGL